MKKVFFEDWQKLLPYLRQEKEFNLFIIGDIENAKERTGNMDLYIDGDIDNPRGVLMRYFKFFVFFSSEDMHFDEAAEIIKDFGEARVLSGKGEVIDKIKPFLGNLLCEEQKSYFAVLKEPEMKNSEYNIQKMTLENSKKVTDLLSTITEFGERDDEVFLDGIKNGSARSYYLEINGETVATASTSAETKEMAMVVAVATDKNHRKKGYATAVINKLCADLTDEGKTACLFYDNPLAGRIYNRIGFRETGTWKMLKLKSEQKQG